MLDVDTTFNMYSDTPDGGDPDAKSATLRKYHKLLWSRPLPNGAMFTLSDSGPKPHLYHQSELGTFRLSSDAITHSYKNTLKMGYIIEQLSPGEVDGLFATGSTIGSYIVFPSNKIDGAMTINGARGCNAKIGDRFDLTLECIRRHYRREDSPLATTLQRYASFFNLFESFEGYVNYFHLQDLVTNNHQDIRFYLPFDGFRSSPLPSSVEEYRTYRTGVMAFVAARNQRIDNRVNN
ncbi:hypothetical protein [Ruegeria sp. HKCCA4633]|uniref:DUF6994 family protein n=1 Tax=Ruegeria sp. HKCCA4633 TaxID=2682983 RepID=UPI001487837E|nr:hypothetical protein [Ruegeria sp. HKCCA4633]